MNKMFRVILMLCFCLTYVFCGKKDTAVILPTAVSESVPEKATVPAEQPVVFKPIFADVPKMETENYIYYTGR
ncbi:hypothetical protein AGMMS49953_08220 [Endomicrobiia bacterium]|nr:hypothetical protein AGMMS49953_08220 [Endomicrobiia bacterium]